jgi:O-antigen/teichoic acid export membrane protein
MSEHLVRASRLVLVLALAVLTGVAIAFAFALLGHEILVLTFGEDLAPIDDTLPMIVAVWTSYLAGAMSTFAILALGWRRLIRR